MLKRISSLVLVLAVGGSVFAGAVRLSREHVCNMTLMKMMPNLETVPEMEVSQMSCVDIGDMESMPEMEMTGMEHMAGMEMQYHKMPDMESMLTMDTSGTEAMPCCKEHQAKVAIQEPANMGLCCVTIPQEPNSPGPTVNLSPSSFSIEVTHAVVVQPPVLPPRPPTRRYVTQFFLPNLQATYVRNLAFLI